MAAEKKSQKAKEELDAALQEARAAKGKVIFLFIIYAVSCGQHSTAARDHLCFLKNEEKRQAEALDAQKGAEKGTGAEKITAKVTVDAQRVEGPDANATEESSRTGA